MNNRNFKTDDVLLTSFLLTQGMNLTGICKDSPAHFIFVLSNSDKCLQLKQNYLNNAPAPAQELFSKREMLIAEIKGKSRLRLASRRGPDRYGCPGDIK